MVCLAEALQRLLAVLFLSILSICFAADLRAQTVGANEIGGVVTSANGPEAGVWVIAETTDLPTKFARIVVTDDQGRYLIPDLPAAGYSVWVRGYGLVDSPKVNARPGTTLNHNAVVAPSEAAAAQYYPAAYWYALLKIPPAKDFGGSTDIPKNITQDNWLRQMNNVDCIGCHQLGQLSTRTIPPSLGQFASGAEAWIRRVASGQTGESMTIGSPVNLAAFRTNISETGLTASPRANYPRASHRGRPASSTTSWSRHGNGAPRNTICTI
jgi:hypothetical protein